MKMYELLECLQIKYPTAKNWKFEVWSPERTHMIRIYRQHCTDVKFNCPKEKLLILDDINCGFEVLCKFIGMEPPSDVEWPHKNKNGCEIESKSISIS